MAITLLQLFGIGFSFGIAGPCFLTCTPILITYIVGSKRKWGEALADTLIFLFGRLAAYILLGGIAGISGTILRHFITSNTPLFEITAGIVSIILGILILFYRESKAHCTTRRTSLFTFGFAIGVAPCAPLMALLFEVSLMSKNIFDGIIYASSFGIGTFISGLVVVGALTGVLSWIPSKLLKSNMSNIIFKTLCALLLILLGLGLIWRSLRL